MVKSPWSVVWVEVDDAEAERAMATRTFSWARRRAAVEIHHHPPVHGGRWLAVSLRAGAWEALARMAVPSAFDPARYESKGAHRLATRYASVLKTERGLSVRRCALDQLEQAVMRIEEVRLEAEGTV